MLRSSCALFRHRLILRNARLISCNQEFVFVRQKSISSWFQRPKQPKSKTPGTQKSKLIIEEEDNDKTLQSQYTYDLKHYLKTTEIPSNLRSRILSTKLSGLIHEVPDFASDKECLRTINSVFMSLNDLQSGEIEKALPMKDLLLLFRSTAAYVLSQDEYELPQFMAILSQKLIKAEADVPTDIYALVIDLGSSMKFNGFEDAFSVVVRNARSLPSDFVDVVLDHFRSKNRLELREFEAICSIAKATRPELLNDDYCKHFTAYVETLFKQSSPNVHEYEDLNKNIYRIEELTSKVMESLRSLSSGSLLQILKFFLDLNTVVEYKSKKESVNMILLRISQLPFEKTKEALLKQDLFDESLCLTLLIELSKDSEFGQFKDELIEFILEDAVRYTPSLKLQAQILHAVDEIDEGEALNQQLEKILNATEKTVDLQDKAMEALMASGRIAPLGDTVQFLESWIKTAYDELPSLISFQLRIERAVELQDRNTALELFNQSLQCDTVQWDQDSAPKTQLLLNKLICLVCNNDESIMTLFPTFREIKQNMTSCCNAEALLIVSKKMVAEECVGDAIELLKRELPKINTESSKRLLITPSWAYAYRQLFEQLHDFTIGYTNEETFETNWVLYGELHKYFAVPFETYLPAMKFFCQKDRLHAALVIFRKIKLLNELHGNHNFLPPSRDMYMYLFKTFGDRLYEEGVIEIHECLKMDVALQGTDIELQNCLLDAYSNLQNVGKARDLFLSMSSNSKLGGGVNEETARIMIKTYTYSDMLYVKKFWNNLSQYGVFPEYSIFKQYVIAHVYHGLVDDAFQLINEIDDYNLEFSSDLLLAMHNYCLQPDKQQQVAQWALENHKEEWDEINRSGLLRKASKYMPESNLLTGND